ncbi:Dabb family protein [Roseicitreum antarcticum]|jgi:hypothetical protein|uniref:Stress responsive A/B Barrel Domain n=1 Tax=Roseicitreum antarcticum TaxID=564137 RepID=A0A1H2U5R3_9RHOB|nr:Dabb family protein [Roseicitreum antarcticum]SDW51553.1 Stress responsive A/B Barrel Domain [Roseicitreum antarcticum]
MLKHCVFVNFKPGIPQDDRLAVLAGFKAVADDVEGLVDYAYGPNLDFENKSAAYGEGFIVTFTDRAAHLQYEAHPTHVRLGKQLVSMCQGGYDGIIVFDLEC